MSNIPPEVGFPASAGDAAAKAAMAAAIRAAGDGDARAMAKAFWESGLPRGTVWRLRENYPALGAVDAEEAVDVAYGELMAKVQDREEIRNLPALFVTIADRKAQRLMKSRKALVAVEGDAPYIVGTLRGGDVRSCCEDDVDGDLYRKEVILKARAYLPRLPDSPSRVMEYVLAHLEIGRDDLTGEEIGGALGMSPGAVRTNLCRARERLERLAVEDGLLGEGELAEVLGEPADDADPDDENRED